MFGIIRTIFGWYLVTGLEEECALLKPNLVYRLYKRFNREFRLEANNYVSKSNQPISLRSNHRIKGFYPNKKKAAPSN